MKIIAVTNQKGGVGKTTTTINLATAIAAIDKQVAIIDLDPQGNSTTSFNIDKSSKFENSYGLMIGHCSFEKSLRQTILPSLSLVPSTINLSASEVELANLPQREFRLKNSLNSDYANKFDFIFIDCPPGFGINTLNALVAADLVLIPMQCEFFALEGLAQLLMTIKKVQKTLNSELQISGILLTMFDKRNSLSKLVENDLRGHFPELVFETKIPRNIKISEAPSHGKPVLLYDCKSLGAQSYISLAKEFLLKTS